MNKNPRDKNDYERILEYSLNCPDKEKEEKSSLCKDICKRTIENEWMTFVGWGNPDSQIVFVAENPREGIKIWCGKKRCFNKKILEKYSKFDFSGDPHFKNFHAKIIEKLFKTKKLEDLKDKAFFTEIILCPGDLKNDIKIKKEVKQIAERCYKKNIKNIIARPRFKFIIALGQVATERIIKNLELEKNQNKKWYEQVIETPEGKYFLSAYHPNRRGKKEPGKVVRRIEKICSINNIKLK